MKNGANRIDYQSKFIRDSIRDIQQHMYITVIGKKQQIIIEQELSIQQIKYREHAYDNDIKMYVKERE